MLLAIAALIGFVAGLATALTVVAYKWGLTRPDWRYQPEGTPTAYQGSVEN